MALNPLDQAIYAIDRKLEVDVYIRNQLLSSGLSDVPSIVNALSVEVDFDIDAIPPTATIVVANIAQHYTKIERGDPVEIDAGFDGNVERIFTGTVKRRSHGVARATIYCVGKTAVLTQPFRVASSDNPAKSWTMTTAVDAILDILDDLSPPLTLYHIDDILMDDGITDFTLVSVRMDAMPASDMIRKIADVYGHRVYEQKSGTLRIRDLLEAPAPTGYRVYGTQGADEISTTTISFDDSNIDSNLALGDATGRARRSQGFTPSADGTATLLTMWLRKVAAPTDKIGFRVETDDGAGAPSGTSLGGGSLVAGSILQVGSYTQIDIAVETETRMSSGTLYHLVVTRSGAVDAVNYYEVGADTGAGYADGIANVFDSVAGTWGAGGGDLVFEVEHMSFPVLRLLDIADDEDEDQVKKQVVVRGATVASTTPASGDPGGDPGGDEMQDQIKGERHTEVDDLIEGDYWLYAALYSSDLIQTATVADEVAARLLSKYHRILQSIEIEVPFDPRIDLGSTIEIKDQGTSPAYTGEVTGLSGQWWVRAYHHSISTTGATTQISLFGGDQGGTSGEANPQADFWWSIERQLVGAAIMAVVTFHDVSTDADGGITTYRWVDDYDAPGGINDVQGEALRVVTFSYNPAVDENVNMTLTVTDNDGNTGSFTPPSGIDTTDSNPSAFVPAIACAAGNTCMVSIDGALSWSDEATPSGDAKVCAATFTTDLEPELLFFFGTDDGHIYRSEGDVISLSEVAATAETGDSEVTDIVPDRAIRERIWACCANGRILRSDDSGANWTIYADLAVEWPTRWEFQSLQTLQGSQFRVNPLPINGMMVSEPGVNRIWVYGGNGLDPESWFHTHYLGDPSSHWVSEVDEDDGSAASTGTEADTVVSTVTSHRTAGDLGLLLTGRNPVFLYAAPRYYDAIGEGSTWVDIGGTPADDGVAVANNHNQLGLFGMVMDNTNFYRSQDGYGTWEELSGVLPGTGANRPHSLLQVTAWKDIYLSATDEGIAKSIDYGETWAFLRGAGGGSIVAWPGGAIGWDIDIAYRLPRSYDLLAIVRDAAASTEIALALRTAAGGWQDEGPLPIGYNDRPHRLWHFPQINDSTAFFLRYSSGIADQAEDLYRSTDLGSSPTTWTKVLDNCGTIARGPNGRIWATAESHAEPTGHLGNQRAPHTLYFSDNDGATFDVAHVDSRNSANQYITYYNIAVDPNNYKRVMCAGLWPASAIRILVSEDAHLGAGATWSEVTPAGLTGFSGVAARYHQPLLIAGEGGRWIIGKQLNAANTLEIWTSDDNGANWTKRYTRALGGSINGLAEAFRMGNILFFGGGMQGNAADTVGLISTNNGIDWTPLNAASNQHQGFVFDAAFNMLIVNIDGADELATMIPPQAGQPWVTGIADGLDAAMGYTAQMVENALAVRRVD